jgi:hypothetical protein
VIRLAWDCGKRPSGPTAAQGVCAGTLDTTRKIRKTKEICAISPDRRGKSRQLRKKSMRKTGSQGSKLIALKGAQKLKRLTGEPVNLEGSQKVDFNLYVATPVLP